MDGGGCGAGRVGAQPRELGDDLCLGRCPIGRHRTVGARRLRGGVDPRTQPGTVAMDGMGNVAGGAHCLWRLGVPPDLFWAHLRHRRDRLRPVCRPSLRPWARPLPLLDGARYGPLPRLPGRLDLPPERATSHDAVVPSAGISPLHATARPRPVHSGCGTHERRSVDRRRGAALRRGPTGAATDGHCPRQSQRVRRLRCWWRHRRPVRPAAHWGCGGLGPLGHWKRLA